MRGVFSDGLVGATTAMQVCAQVPDFFLLLRREAALAAFEKDEDVYPWLFFSFTGHFVENAILAIHAMCCSMFSWSL